MASASNNRSMKVLDQFHVSPLLPKSSESLHPPLPLTFFDVMWLFQSPVERVFLFDYPHPTTHFIQSHLPNLKSSLSLTLACFYPLAGKLQRCPDADDRFELRYEDGDSVTLTLAECGAEFLDGSRPRDFAALGSLVPKLGKPEVGGPLIAIQVTIFPYQGVAVGISVHHLACDGHSSIDFIKSWAAACRSGELLDPHPIVEHTPPSYDRTATLDPFGVYKAMLQAVEGFKEKASAASPGQTAATETNLVMAAFNLGLDDIRGVKKMVIDQANSQGNKPSGSHVSTFVVSCAYVWVCFAKVRERSSDQSSLFAFMIDWRRRMEPPVEASYFGNCVWPCLVEAKAEELVGRDGVVVASEAIGAAIQEDLKDGLGGTIQRIFKKAGGVMRQPLAVAGSPKFGVYDVDFGWGRPRMVDVVSIHGGGAISLSESREETGGVQIGLVLPQDEMEEFKAHFVGGLRPS